MAAALISDDNEELRTVAQFLAYAKLDGKADGYLELLSRAGLDAVEDVPEADDEALASAGMSKLFHRKRFLSQ